MRFNVGSEEVDPSDYSPSIMSMFTLLKWEFLKLVPRCSPKGLFQPIYIYIYIHISLGPSCPPPIFFKTGKVGQVSLRPRAARSVALAQQGVIRRMKACVKSEPLNGPRVGLWGLGFRV